MVFDEKYVKHIPVETFVRIKEVGQSDLRRGVRCGQVALLKDYLEKTMILTKEIYRFPGGVGFPSLLSGLKGPPLRVQLHEGEMFLYPRLSRSRSEFLSS